MRERERLRREERWSRRGDRSRPRSRRGDRDRLRAGERVRTGDLHQMITISLAFQHAKTLKATRS